MSDETQAPSPVPPIPDRPEGWAVTLWNMRVPPGSAVTLAEDDGAMTPTMTRSEAWLLDGGIPVVKVEGKTGGYLLWRIMPAPEGE